MTRGLGQYHRQVRERKHAKIIFSLCKEGPLTKYKLSVLTGIHRAGRYDRKNIIQLALDKLVKYQLIYNDTPSVVSDAYRSYYLANWSHPLTRLTFYKYRNIHENDYFYFTEYEDLENELDERFRNEIQPMAPQLRLEYLLNLQINHMTGMFDRKEHKMKEDAFLLKLKDKKELANSIFTDFQTATKKLDSISHLQSSQQSQEGRIEIMTDFRDSFIQVCKILGFDDIISSVSTDGIKDYWRKDMIKLDKAGILNSKSNLYHKSKFDNAMNRLIELVASRKKEIKAILQMDYDEETKRQQFGDDYNLEEIAQLAPFDILVEAKLKKELK